MSKIGFQCIWSSERSDGFCPNLHRYIVGRRGTVEMVHLSTHNICFGWEIGKLFFWYTLLTKGLYKYFKADYIWVQQDKGWSVFNNWSYCDMLIAPRCGDNQFLWFDLDCSMRKWHCQALLNMSLIRPKYYIFTKQSEKFALPRKTN